VNLTDQHIIGVISFLVGIVSTGVVSYFGVITKLSNLDGQLVQLMKRPDFVDKNTEEIGKIKNVIRKHDKDLNAVHQKIREVTIPPRSMNT
jgi:hypothetical protein